MVIGYSVGKLLIGEEILQCHTDVSRIQHVYSPS